MFSSPPFFFGITKYLEVFHETSTVYLLSPEKSRLLHPRWPQLSHLCLLGQGEGGADEGMFFSTCIKLFFHRVDLVILNSYFLMLCI